MDLQQAIDSIDDLMSRALRAGRIPGAGMAIVAQGQIALSRGYGFRDLRSGLPLTADTAYPIASTTKALNATLIGMLVDEGKLAWDTPVQEYLPGFRLKDPVAGAQATLRDLLSLRTGLPRHDWMWLENPLTRAELVHRLRYLEPFAGFREKFQYHNMTATTAGYIAEVVTGKGWNDLIQERLLTPLQMQRTGFANPTDNATLSYHEDSNRNLLLSERFVTDVTAPSGGVIHSTVTDMTRWMLFNLNGGTYGSRALIQPKTLAEVQAPQMPARTDPSCPTPNAAYAMGWFVDTYNGRARLTHGGYLHDVNSEVSLHPQEGIGIVSFTNFGCPGLARTLNQHAYDLLMGFPTEYSFENKLADYEKNVEQTRVRNASLERVENTSPSHPLNDYAGTYGHPGYGILEVRIEDRELVLRRNTLMLRLQHWHYDAWVVKDAHRFVIHAPHPFERANRWRFETNAEGEIAGLVVALEPAIAPLRFEKTS